MGVRGTDIFIKAWGASTSAATVEGEISAKGTSALPGQKAREVILPAGLMSSVEEPPSQAELAKLKRQLSPTEYKKRLAKFEVKPPEKISNKILGEIKSVSKGMVAKDDALALLEERLLSGEIDELLKREKSRFEEQFR